MYTAHACRMYGILRIDCLNIWPTHLVVHFTDVGLYLLRNVLKPAFWMHAHWSYVTILSPDPKIDGDKVTHRMSAFCYVFNDLIQRALPI